MAWETEGVANTTIQEFFRNYLGRNITDEQANRWRLEHTDIVGGFLTNQAARDIIKGSTEGVAYGKAQAVSTTDPWLALEQQTQKLEWQRWVNENGWQVNQLWERFTGRSLSNDELLKIASSGEGSAPYLEKIARFQEWSPAFETFTTSYGKAPSTSQIKDIMRTYETPAQYGAWVGAEAQTTANLSRIQELFRTELGKDVTRKPVQQYFAGYASSGDFARQLDEARRRREYRYNQVKSGPGYEAQGGRLRLANWY